ncbi:hypothetical protein SL1157_2869 [Ruegeria lacuscaerulensis ITI-1157]|nr:hypothetical protein SL1157_2869 [Ruegeria lacuscaerulensis ITI-1157]
MLVSRFEKNGMALEQDVFFVSSPTFEQIWRSAPNVIPLL